MRKAVVVHGGARDAYQLALALAEGNLLECLVTDLFWPLDQPWARRIEQRLSPGIKATLRRRSAKGLPWQRVTMCVWSGLRELVLQRLPRVPLWLRRQSIRAADARLGRVAGRRARHTHSGLVTYSYYGYDAMTSFGQPAMLFQVHPHPATIRRILTQELEDHPECADSLQQEWELALPEADFQHLVNEPKMASVLLAASTFTKASLIEHGVHASTITVLPYGVDLERFHPASPTLAPPNDRLHLLFVGRINQRKGIKYLLEALKSFHADEVHLTVCGRVVDDLKLFEGFGTQVELRPSVDEAALVAAYQSADLFVFPSVAEGFGQVLLEALACGLPILSTTHTAAPDLIEDGVQGFIVPPRRVDLLTEKIRWALEHRAALRAMGVQARVRAELFTWARFRDRASSAVEQYLRSYFEKADA